MEEKAANGAAAYYIGDSKRPVLLSLLRGADGKTNVEIRIAPFALPQALEAGDDIYGLPTPKLRKSAGGTRGRTVHEVHALVPAEVGSVLAFYRGELAKRNWKEETAGAVVNPDKAVLAFSSADGMAELKLGRKYDLTTVSLVLQVKEPAVKPVAQENSVDEIMKQAQQAIREATNDALTRIEGAAGIEPSHNGNQSRPGRGERRRRQGCAGSGAGGRRRCGIRSCRRQA